MSAAGVFDSVQWFFDCGHGWLRVPLMSCEGLDISIYSYIDRGAGFLYLEEDCDAGVWLDAHGVQGSAFPGEHAEGNADSFVRSLPRVPETFGAVVRR